MKILDFKKYLKESAKCLGIYLNSDELNVFEVYKNILKEWNTEKLNLTAIVEDEEIAQKHFIDSLILTKAIDLKKDGLKLVDVGTGAGFPGIPLKVTNRNIQLTLIEAQRNKALFLGVLLSRIGLPEVNVFNNRGEELSRDEAFREKFDIVTMREFGKVALNLEIGLPFVKPGGYLVLWKGKEDLPKIEKYKEFAIELGATFEEPFKYKLNDNKTRYLFILKKGWSTPKKYPRSYASILKSARKNGD